MSGSCSSSAFSFQEQLLAACYPLSSEKAVSILAGHFRFPFSIFHFIFTVGGGQNLPEILNAAVIFLGSERYHPTHLLRSLPCRPRNRWEEQNDGARPLRSANAIRRRINQVASRKTTIQNTTPPSLAPEQHAGALYQTRPRSGRSVPFHSHSATRPSPASELSE